MSRSVSIEPIRFPDSALGEIAALFTRALSGLPPQALANFFYSGQPILAVGQVDLNVVFRGGLPPGDPWERLGAHR
jgi:hypothetical protein